MEGVKYYASEPVMLGRVFLRLERDFDKHVSYCRDEPLAQHFLQNNLEAKDYFMVSEEPILILILLLQALIDR